MDRKNRIEGIFSELPETLCFDSMMLGMSTDDKYYLRDCFRMSKDTYPIEVYLVANAIIRISDPGGDLGSFVYCDELDIWVEDTDTVHQIAKNMLKELV